MTDQGAPPPEATGGAAQPQVPQTPGTAPAAPTYQTAKGPSGPRAGFWRRFGAAFIDGILLGIVNFAISAAFGQSLVKTTHTNGNASVHIQATGLAFILELVIAVAYFAYFEGGASGQTLGKRAVGIRVIDYSSGGPIGYGRAILRFFARYLSALVCFLGYLWMLWDKEKQTWHDKIATALVVPADAYPVNR
ncbi:MAG: RDD family protein [Actinomycetota bacterium]|nr:RDD family protein [Actinomycetota bacterium]